jgi:hypothetical protein
MGSFRLLAALMVGAVVVAALLLHAAGRGELTEDTLAAAPTVEGLPIASSGSLFLLPQTTVVGSGNVSLRVGVGAPQSQVEIKLTITDDARRRLGSISYPRGSVKNGETLHCLVGDLSKARRVFVESRPASRALSTIGGLDGSVRRAGRLEVPRRSDLANRLHTVIDRIGARRTPPFDGWLLLVGLFLAVSSFAFVALTVLRETLVPDSRRRS